MPEHRMEWHPIHKEDTMSSSMSGVVGMPLGGPVSTVSEGGIQTGSFSIQSMNTTAIMQMYNNTANMWNNVVNFGMDMSNLSFKWLKYEHDKAKGLQKATMTAEAHQETQAQARRERENAELKRSLLQMQINNQRTAPGGPLTSGIMGEKEFEGPDPLEEGVTPS